MNTLKTMFKTGFTTCALILLPLMTSAQDMGTTVMDTDSLKVDMPATAEKEPAETVAMVEEEQKITADSLAAIIGKPARMKRDWNKWKPNPKRAMWLALVCPGAGQIYNRKYWKLPIFAGGFVGCFYAYSWNNQMYSDYKQAYLDITDNDPNTKSYEKFLHLGSKIDESNIQRYQNLFSKRKDRFRRYRDLSFFCILGVYALSVIDAYVDASLSEFDISDDLSLRIEPAFITNGTSRSPLLNGAWGVQCSLNF